MRIAWFRAGASPPVDLQSGLPSGIAGCSPAPIVDVVTESLAHDFVVEQAHRPYDVCIFEPRNDPASDFIWAYLFQYPGILLLQDRSLHDSRVRALERHRRSAEYAREFEFNHGHQSRGAEWVFARGTWPMLRAPMLASRMVVVADEERRAALERACPESRVRVVPPCATAPSSVIAPPAGRGSDTPLRVAVGSGSPRRSVATVIEQLCAAGVPITLLPDAPPHVFHPDADVVVALESLGLEASLTSALTAMAGERAVVVFEREATAIFPAIDPQTWRPRDSVGRQNAVAITIDPRDEAHSLALALRGLARDRERIHTLGDAARRWWLANATPEHAANVWRGLLAEAARLQAPAHPADWPPHLTVDGEEQGRAIAAEMGFVFEL